ncbi:hypothetical protein B8W99_25575 [Peribacillus simplex]|nr:hypothetical protein B8W99_25575 [Peribacillus simplex]
MYVMCKKGGRLVRCLLKGIMKVNITLLCLVISLYSYHLVFHPNVGTSVAEDCKSIIFYFSQGVIIQYCIMHFFNKQEQDQESN